MEDFGLSDPLLMVVPFRLPTGTLSIGVIEHGGCVSPNYALAATSDVYARHGLNIVLHAKALVDRLLEDGFPARLHENEDDWVV